MCECDKDFEASSHTPTDNREEREGPIISQLYRVNLAVLVNWNAVIQEVVVVGHNTAPSLSFSYKVRGHRVFTLLCAIRNWR